MKRKITLDIVKEEFENVGYELVSTEYKNNSAKIKYICSKHKDKGILEIIYGNFHKGERCRYCSNRYTMSTLEYKEKLQKVKPNIEVIEQYVNLKTKIKHKCKICEYEWCTRPDNLLYNVNGCPNCGKRRTDWTTEEIQKRVQELHPNIKMFGEYNCTADYLTFYCEKCENSWTAKVNNILNGKGCPHCSKSIGEKKIEQYLKNINIVYETQKTFKDCKDKDYLKFDFYIPSSNVCIEYDGIQHFKPTKFSNHTTDKQAQESFELCKKHDMIKTEYCNKNNIKLLRISYKENIEKVLLSFFNN